MDRGFGDWPAEALMSSAGAQAAPMENVAADPCARNPPAAPDSTKTGLTAKRARNSSAFFSRLSRCARGNMRGFEMIMRMAA
jgi:hypothetical protein